MRDQPWYKPLQDYFRQTRHPLYAFYFVLPLILFYEAGILALHRQGVMLRNKAEGLLRQFFEIFNISGFFLFTLLILGIYIALLIRSRKERFVHAPRYFLYLPLECVVYAMLLAVLIRKALIFFALPMRLSPFAQLVLSLGAGVYEEFVFRVLLLALFSWVFTSGLKIEKRWGSPLAVLFSAVVFSLFHHLGPYGERFVWKIFLIRAGGGVFFCLLYLARGFGVAAWTHALYDVFVILFAR